MATALLTALLTTLLTALLRAQAETRVVQQTLDPVWEQSLDFANVPQLELWGGTLRLLLYDDDAGRNAAREARGEEVRP